MPARDLLRKAVDELYSCDPDEFMARRTSLAAEARQSGDAPVAKQIAGLRKPTRSAWIVNQLVRSRSGVTAELADLGDELRAAERALDGGRIRALSVRRRQLIDALVRQAFQVSAQRSPSATLRDEVIATLGAAVADPQVAEQLQAGTLLRPARWDGFGADATPALTLVPAPTGGPRTSAGKSAEKPARAKTPGRATAVEAAAAAKAEQERRRHEVITEAEQAVAAADNAAQVAMGAEQEQQQAVRLVEEQLADARRHLDGARREARRARVEQRKAHQALGRLRG